VPLVPPKQIVDATHLQRRSADDIEVVVLSQSGGSSLMTFQLNRRPIAKLRQGEAILLYLSPARYRFGVIHILTPPFTRYRRSRWTSRKTRRKFIEYFRVAVSQAAAGMPYSKLPPYHPGRSPAVINAVT